MSKGPSRNEQMLIANILEYKYDPLGFVMYAFPWGEPNTPLADNKKPRQWQIDELNKIKMHLEMSQQLVAVGLNPQPYYLAISSGRGVGKSAFLNMLNHWVMSC